MDALGANLDALGAKLCALGANLGALGANLGALGANSQTAWNFTKHFEKRGRTSVAQAEKDAEKRMTDRQVDGRQSYRLCGNPLVTKAGLDTAERCGWTPVLQAVW